MRALVIEGGGMRASYSNGALASLEEAGLTSFGGIYGTSAGGALAAWFSARQARYALGTWDYAQDRRVLSWRRWLTGRGPLLHHDDMFRIIYEEERPLDVQRVRASPHPVVVTVTNADTGRAEYVDIRAGPVLAWLKATGRLPLATGPAVEIDGRRYLDGGLTDPVPLRRALADGATEIVCILNTPPGERSPEPALVERLVARRYPACAGLIERHHEIHAEALVPLASPPAGVAIHVIRPEKPTGVGRLTRDPSRIRAAIEQGRADGKALLARVQLQSV